MKLGLRARLFLVSTLIIFVAVLGGGAYLEANQRAHLERRTEAELLLLVQTARVAIEHAPSVEPAAGWQQLASSLATSTHARVTIVDGSGRVLADSELAADEVPHMENHAQRPEIVGARLHGRGVSRRASTTLSTDMLYVAVPFERAGNGGVVRVALLLDEVDREVGRVRSTLAITALFALTFSLFMSMISAHFVTKTVQDLFSVARALVRVDPTHRAQSPTGDELGGLAGSINEIAQAFTENVRILAAERDRFGAVLDGMGEAVVAVDAEGRITLFNHACIELLQSTEPAVGRPLMEAIRHPVLHDLADKAMRTGAASGELEVQTPGGRRLLVRAAPLSPAVGGAVLVMRDVTALRRLENVRRDFIANVSHELRTPVSTIRATAETLLDGALDDREHAQRFLNALVRSAERLSRIIADLLDLSRIEAGELAIDTQPASLSVAVHRALELVDNNAQAKSLTMVNEVDPEATALADEKALDQVVLNLLDNAVKYTPQGGRIIVRVVPSQQGNVRLEVEDDGAGIPDKHKERIFERFYRVDPGRSRALGGTGLGLAIVRHLVEAMAGTVGVLPARPHGAIFFVELPEAPRSSGEPPPLATNS